MDSHQVFVWSVTFFTIAILSVLFLFSFLNNSTITGNVTQSSVLPAEFKLSENQSLIASFSGQADRVIEVNVDCFAVQQTDSGYNIALIQKNPQQSLFTGTLSAAGEFSLQNQFDYTSCPLVFLERQGKIWVKAGILNYPFSKN